MFEGNTKSKVVRELCDKNGIWFI